MIGSMRARQRGASAWQWLTIILVVGFFLLLAAKLGPLYITNYTIHAVINELRGERELASQSVQEIRAWIQKTKFDTNRVELIQAQCLIKEMPCIKVEKSKDKLRIDANYETRVHIIGNVDAVVKFEDNSVELPITGGS